jgi:hypothetical protein
MGMLAPTYNTTPPPEQWESVHFAFLLPCGSKLYGTRKERIIKKKIFSYKSLVKYSTLSPGGHTKMKITLDHPWIWTLNDKYLEKNISGEGGGIWLCYNHRAVQAVEREALSSNPSTAKEEDR